MQIWSYFLLQLISTFVTLVLFLLIQNLDGEVALGVAITKTKI